MYGNMEKKWHRVYRGGKTKNKSNDRPHNYHDWGWLKNHPSMVIFRMVYGNWFEALGLPHYGIVIPKQDEYYYICGK